MFICERCRLTYNLAYFKGLYKRLEIFIIFL